MDKVNTNLSLEQRLTSDDELIRYRTVLYANTIMTPTQLQRAMQDSSERVREIAKRISETTA